MGRLKERGIDIGASTVTPPLLAGLLDRIADNTVSGKLAKDVLDAMLDSGKDADTVIDEKGMRQVTDTGAIDAVIREVMDANAGLVEQYRAGKDRRLGFFVGQVMKASRGKANPELVNERLRELLKG